MQTNVTATRTQVLLQGKGSLVANEGNKFSQVQMNVGIGSKMDAGFLLLDLMCGNIVEVKKLEKGPHIERHLRFSGLHGDF